MALQKLVRDKCCKEHCAPPLLHGHFSQHLRTLHCRHSVVAQEVYTMSLVKSNPLEPNLALANHAVIPRYILRRSILLVFFLHFSKKRENSKMHLLHIEVCILHIKLKQNPMQQKSYRSYVNEYIIQSGIVFRYCQKKGNYLMPWGTKHRPYPLTNWQMADGNWPFITVSLLNRHQHQQTIVHLQLKVTYPQLQRRYNWLTQSYNQPIIEPILMPIQ